MPDAVNSPGHYQGETWECIDIIRALNLDYWRGNALKYIVRHENKGGYEDIAKAMWYLRDALGNDDVLISMSYNLANDHAAASPMNGQSIAGNFDLDDDNLVAAIDVIVDSAKEAFTKPEIETALTEALGCLRAFLNDAQQGDAA